MSLIPLLLLLASGVPQAGQTLVRVAVVTDISGDADDLADRRQSVEDLTKALMAKGKKGIVVVTPEEAEATAADITVEVVGRGVTTPRFVMGLPSRPGQPGSPVGPVRTAQLRVRLTYANGDDPVVLTNKNKPALSPNGWKSSAENLADQIEKLITGR